MKFAKFKKKSLIALSSILVLSSLVGCQSNSSEKDGTIKIGLVAPLSGAMAQDGKSILNAAQLAVDEVNKEGGINKKRESQRRLHPLQINIHQIKILWRLWEAFLHHVL